MTTIFERIKAIVVEQLGVDAGEVVPTASFAEDLGADSLDLVELIMSLEEATTQFDWSVFAWFNILAYSESYQ